jgi:hypothetical protein
MPRTRLAMLFIAALLAAGCGGSDNDPSRPVGREAAPRRVRGGSLDMTQAHATVALVLERNFGGPARSLTCPAHVPAERGRTFRCEAVLQAGAHVSISVTQKDDRGNLRIVFRAPPTPS